ncbi:MAG: helix-turn-helix transcriptional regulator [Spirosomataceae bacterium]
MKINKLPPPTKNLVAPTLPDIDIDVLTTQERKIIQLAADDLTNKEIAACLYISEKTVKCHRKNAYKKLGIHSKLAIRKLLIWVSKMKKE